METNDEEVNPVIPRYTRPDMGRIWSDENRFRTWLTVEVAATEVSGRRWHGPERCSEGHSQAR